MPRGRYRIDVTKPNYQGQTRIVDVDVAETKPLFFKLEPIPARLEIETVPPGATLYVNGNRARNPYRQDVAPGPFEIFAEAPDYERAPIEFTLAPGEHKRAGRAATAFSLIVHAALGAARAASSPRRSSAASSAPAPSPRRSARTSIRTRTSSSVLLATGGGISGGIVGALVATPLVPSYIPDNRALFIIGGMWIGARRRTRPRASSGTSRSRPPAGRPRTPPVVRALPRRRWATSCAPGSSAASRGWRSGSRGARLLGKHAPTYGRVAMIQSAALGGAIVRRAHADRDCGGNRTGRPGNGASCSNSTRARRWNPGGMPSNGAPVHPAGGTNVDELRCPKDEQLSI